MAGVHAAALVAGAMALALAVLAAAMLGRAAEERDLARRLRAVLRPAERRTGAEPGIGAAALRPVAALGEALRARAVVSERETQEFGRALAASGFDPKRAVPAFIGLKALLLLAGPACAFAATRLTGQEPADEAMILGAALVLSVFGPNWLMAALRRPYQDRLRRGLPDALDLLVVAAEAGLGLDSAVDRVAREMAGSNRAVALELNTLVQEMRMLPDRRVALERLRARTGIEGFRRLAATLSQTLRYGTPLAQALRVLAGELRADRMLRIEEKAIRLPALLIGPLILFILPALFIALIGPSVIEMGRTFG
ncbi:type II secretion system F family protein [Falsiroseomonas sp. CW058]|uniref:type II secretion system F family protein n=1 Tax=Falsiroseomonas sp. CW058 TaxID=3388664 RepID=UPI003D32261B